jgi:hypothetical protein
VRKLDGNVESNREKSKEPGDHNKDCL